jgi:AcrR family transcriptional regulator
VTRETNEADTRPTHAPAATSPARRRGAARAARESDGRLRITAGSPPDIMCRVALDLFAEQNYSTVTVKDIALAAGMNPSHLYYYFDNKEELFMRTIARVVEEAFDQFAAVTRTARTPEAVISAWIDLHIRQFVQFRKVAKMSLDYAIRKPMCWAARSARASPRARSGRSIPATPRSSSRPSSTAACFAT